MDDHSTHIPTPSPSPSIISSAFNEIEEEGISKEQFERELSKYPKVFGFLPLNPFYTHIHPNKTLKK
jgi:hypothetical protein